jgi:hypothetical protein
VTDRRTTRRFLVDLLTYPLIVAGVLLIQILTVWDRMKGWYGE